MHANPYIGLKYDLSRVKPDRLDPLLNKPRAATQVFRDKLDRAGSWGEYESSLSKSSVHATQTRTMVQFSAMDFGMDEHLLVFHLPGPTTRVWTGPRSTVMRPNYKSARLTSCGFSKSTW
ncbi:uncharacterized protein B0H18DRAFT_1121805 [Fomitopsis serialis]|uniref:uncharacterized protein n=1 Tax=Fomitopsis serialis TaxID=139415 RepID=UPI00200862B9|nr:uncharacterized protein B0H18DRAFT_1121805 [Neoantrodia serialis]KAH9920713.1 hypothetical protein B0H18DRAFT_1121805 [Neoantrodia serialis]